MAEGPLPYWAAAPATAEQPVPSWEALPPPAAAPGGWAELPPPPRTFSALCAGALVAGACSAVLLVVERDLGGAALGMLLLAVVVSLAALTTTDAKRVTNHWMAVTGLLLALLPLVPALLVWLFLVFLFRNGLYG